MRENQIKKTAKLVDIHLQLQWFSQFSQFLFACLIVANFFTNVPLSALKRWTWWWTHYDDGKSTPNTSCINTVSLLLDNSFLSSIRETFLYILKLETACVFGKKENKYVKIMLFMLWFSEKDFKNACWKC